MIAKLTILVSLLMVTFFVVSSVANAVTNTDPVEGYVYPLSGAPGTVLHFFVSLPSPDKSYTVTILRYGPSNTSGQSSPETVVSPVSETNGIVQNYGATAYVSGAGWVQSFSETIQSSWKSGIYAAVLIDTKTKATFYVTFVVEATSRAPILVMANVNTWEAYNYWPSSEGGAFYYDYGSSCPDPPGSAPEGDGRQSVSFLRPNPEANPNPIDQLGPCDINRTEHLVAGNTYITRWLEREGWSYSMITDQDVISNPSLLNPKVSPTLIIPTHSEYWTQSMYNAVNSYLAAGGNVLVLSGNTAYRYVTASNNASPPSGNGSKMTGNQTITKVYPGTEGDGGIPPSTQANTFGLASAETSPSFGCTPYSVLAPLDPFYNGAGVAAGQSIGTSGVMTAVTPCENPNSEGEYASPPPSGWGASGWETDKPYNPGFNRTYDILAEGQNPNGAFGAILYYQRYSAGQVFDVGSVTFGQSLLADSYSSSGEGPLSTMTENVLTRFAHPSFTDFTSDGVPDVLAVDTSGNLHLYTGTGHGAFVQNGGPVIDTGWEAFETLFPVGDFAGNGTQDLLAKTPGGELYLYRENGHGGLEEGGQLIDSGWNAYNMIIPVGHFAGDGSDDVLARDSSGNLYLYRGNGQGGFVQGRTLVGTGWNGINLIVSVGDFAGIGSPDLLARDTEGNLRLYAGNGSGGFLNGTGGVIDTGWNIYNALIPVGNFAGDGTDDILARDGSGNLYLYRSNSTGTGFVQERQLVGSGWAGFTTTLGQW
jgi:hypothetical protein